MLKKRFLYIFYKELYIYITRDYKYIFFSKNQKKWGREKRSKKHMDLNYLNILWKYKLVDPQVKTVFYWYGLFKYKHFLFVNVAWDVASNEIYFSLSHFLCHIVTSLGRVKSGVMRKEQNCGNLLQTGTDWWVDRLSLYGYKENSDMSLWNR